MQIIDETVLGQLPLSEILKVSFYKHDEITTDLVCCDVVVRQGDVSAVWTFHEEMMGFETLIDHLEKLPNFRSDWRDVVILPPFAESLTVAFSR